MPALWKTLLKEQKAQPTGRKYLQIIILFQNKKTNQWNIAKRFEQTRHQKDIHTANKALKDVYYQ